MIGHCKTCRCDFDAEERARREREERDRRKAELREFARRHSILTEEDLAWLRSRATERTP